MMHFSYSSYCLMAQSQRNAYLFIMQFGKWKENILLEYLLLKCQMNCAVRLPCWVKCTLKCKSTENKEGGRLFIQHIHSNASFITENVYLSYTVSFYRRSFFFPLSSSLEQQLWRVKSSNHDKKNTFYYLWLSEIHGFSIRQLFEDFCWATHKLYINCATLSLKCYKWSSSSCIVLSIVTICPTWLHLLYMHSKRRMRLMKLSSVMCPEDAL